MLKLAFAVTALITVIIFSVTKLVPVSPNTSNPHQHGNSFGKIFLLNMVMAAFYVTLAISALFGSGSGDGVLISALIVALLHGVIAIVLSSLSFSKKQSAAGVGYLVFGVLILIPAVIGALLLAWASNISHFQ
jgi:hypothetical protein